MIAALLILLGLAGTAGALLVGTWPLLTLAAAVWVVAVYLAVLVAVDRRRVRRRL